ncbi:acyl-CoA dehydrogenase family protein [Arthrobacter bambusae]|uniref:acyl-CoA dehydrogenase family protein n=1 Tax=Arthrobacter bambusae TaxID=1338426 RepID=UPI00278A95BF|nr:acyl-CoA dehydrogenase family protein [Arthrobacter bambusae]MDQ0028471.1 alkylation response protein AidB-like acyl-CoA dehydrogenase [Arthrobacter bambusae]MDQ0096734.1 alkylation response protein AidB-like acyl-CoA dehydrogenase [Arthrobacter bambusae]
MGRHRPSKDNTSKGVRLGKDPLPDDVELLLSQAEERIGDVPALLALAESTGRTAPAPGEGQTARLWEILASLAAVDVAAARVFEPHLDAGAILKQAGQQALFNGTWGVFAAEGPAHVLEAHGIRPASRPGATGPAATAGVSGASGVTLSGSKPWCSLAGYLDHAIVTAKTQSGSRQAFAVDLRSPGVEVEEPLWISHGLREIPSGTVHFTDVPAVPVGEPGWYFERPGFAWGGIGVAACWLGGAVGLVRTFRDALGRREPDQIALSGLGEADRLLASGFELLRGAAAGIDGGTLGDREDSDGAWAHALRVRGNVAAIVERIQEAVGENLGPGPLARDERHAKRVSDLRIYVRQHHGQRDDAQLGSLVLKGESAW